MQDDQAPAGVAGSTPASLGGIKALPDACDRGTAPDLRSRALIVGPLPTSGIAAGWCKTGCTDEQDDAGQDDPQSFLIHVCVP